MIGLRDGAPATAAAEKRDEMRVIALCAIEMHEHRALAVNPKRAGGDQSAFDAMCAVLSQYLTHRQHRLATVLVIDRHRIEERLDFLRRGQPTQRGELVFGKAEIITVGKTAVSRSHI